MFEWFDNENLPEFIKTLACIGGNGMIEIDVPTGFVMSPFWSIASSAYKR
jgi:hypothetical protein